MRSFLCLLLLVLVTVSCQMDSRTTGQNQGQASFPPGSQMPPQIQQVQQPSVFVRGEVKNHVVPWSEGLTLTEAIVAAEYRGSWDPHTILVVRQGQTYKVNPKHLVWGTENPVLEPGDIVEVQR